MSDASREAEKTEIALEEGQEASSSHPNPHIRDVAEQDIGSAIAVAGHPIHAMLVHFPIAFVIATLGIDIFYWFTGDAFWLQVGIWSAGAAFVFGVLAAVVGTAELLAVPGIRVRVASWNHAIAAMVMLAIVGANAGLRIFWPETVLPNGLMLSVLSSMAAAFAGWHGGKLIFDHGVGLLISAKD
jgi:uncharacterized membrane protein